MTKKPEWKKIQAKRSGSGTVVGIIIVFLFLLVLSFGTINKLQAKSVSYSSNSGTRKGANSYLAILETKPTSLFVYLKDAKKAELFTLDDQKNVINAEGDNKLVTIADLKNQQNGLNFLNTMTLAFRTKISNYFVFDKTQQLQTRNIKSEFEKFTSIWTPIAILLTGPKVGLVKDTNITRIDAIRLWWQLKAIRADNIKITNLADFDVEKTDEDGKKVLGADESRLARILQKTIESDEVINEHISVNLNNPGNDNLATQLAAGFIESIGADLGNITSSGPESTKTVIYANDKSSNTIRYLATLFDCDIKSLSEVDNRNKIQIILGSDFRNTYLK